MVHQLCELLYIVVKPYQHYQSAEVQNWLTDAIDDKGENPISDRWWGASFSSCYQHQSREIICLLASVCSSIHHHGIWNTCKVQDLCVYLSSGDNFGQPCSCMVDFWCLYTVKSTILYLINISIWIKVALKLCKISICLKMKLLVQNMICLHSK